MFSVYTTSDVIVRFLEALNSKDFVDSPWLYILSLQMDIHYTNTKVVEDRDLEKDVFFLSSLGDGRYNFIDDTPYIESLREHPEKVLDHPDSVFLLDISDDEAKAIERGYGVVCQPTSRIDEMCRIAEDSYRWRLRKTEDRTRKCWRDLLGKNASSTPSNAMIMIDRNWFSEKDNNTCELFGVEGLRDLLDTILPSHLKCAYHVLIVYEMRKRHWSDHSTDETDFIQSKEFELNEKMKDLRDYPILVELLAVKRNYKDKSYNYEKYNEMHSRRAFTNYFYLGGDYSLAPFLDSGPRATQDINREFLFSDYLIRDSRDLAVHETAYVLELVDSILHDPIHHYECNEPLKNRLIEAYGREVMKRDARKAE